MLELVTDLSLASPVFRQLWSRYDIQEITPCQMQLNHSLAGMLHLNVTSFQVQDRSDLSMVIHTPVPGTDTLAKLTALVTAGSHQQSLADQAQLVELHR